MHARRIFSELKFTHVYFGGLGESTNRMYIVIEDDDAHHDAQTERHSALTAETATVLTGKRVSVSMNTETSNLVKH